MRLFLVLTGFAAIIPDNAVGLGNIADVAGCVLGILYLINEVVVSKRTAPKNNDNLAT